MSHPISDLQVLVVDDNVDTTESAALLFEMQGVNVTKAYDGVSALEIVKARCPDLILLDLAMPHVNGYEVIAALQTASLPKTPFVVAVTGYGRDTDKSRCIEAGFDLHLTKPMDAEMVMRLLVLVRETAHFAPAVRQVLASTAAKQSRLIHLLIDTTRHLLDLATVTQDTATRRRCFEKAARVREIVLKSMQTSPQSTAQLLSHIVVNDALDRVFAAGRMQMGTIQLLNAHGQMEIAAQRGFTPDSLHHFEMVNRDDASVFSRALRLRTTVAIDDVENGDTCATDRAAAAAANFRAVCASPLIVPDGAAVGVLSTHFSGAYTFAPSEIEAHASLARQAASLVNWASG